MTFLDEVINWVDNGSPVDVIYLDFKKAFDKVPHNRLMLKVKGCGITGDIANWVKTWLENRKQRVVIGDSFSDWKSVLSGVPQGSVLGPLLFVIFINDLDNNIANKLLKFADDAKLFGKVNTDRNIDSLRSDLNELYQWSADWGMIFNVDKCKVMHIGPKNKQVHFKINDQQLVTVDEEKDLGITICDNLKVATQCAEATKKANKILGCIKRTFTSRKKNIILPLYKSLVRPHLEYSVPAWRPFLIKDINLLEGVQRRATKVIKDFKNISYNERLFQLNLTTLETRRIRGDLIEVFKIFHGFTDINPREFFTLSDSGLRGHAFKLFKPRAITNICKFSFAHRVVDTWNKLPVDIVNSCSLNSFKNNIDHLFKHGWGLI